MLREGPDDWDGLRERLTGSGREEITSNSISVFWANERSAFDHSGNGGELDLSQLTAQTQSVRAAESMKGRNGGLVFCDERRGNHRPSFRSTDTVQIAIDTSQQIIAGAVSGTVLARLRARWQSFPLVGISDRHRRGHSPGERNGEDNPPHQFNDCANESNPKDILPELRLSPPLSTKCWDWPEESFRADLQILRRYLRTTAELP